MPKLKPNQVPAYRLHKRSEQAIVTLSGRDHLRGKHGCKESRAKYDRLVGEWVAGGVVLAGRMPRWGGRPHRY
jgi:hypothetical protein